MKATTILEFLDTLEPLSDAEVYMPSSKHIVVAREYVEDPVYAILKGGRASVLAKYDAHDDQGDIRQAAADVVAQYDEHGHQVPDGLREIAEGE